MASGVSIRYATASGTGSWCTATASTRTLPSSLVQINVGTGRDVERTEYHLDRRRTRVLGAQCKVVVVGLEHAADEASGQALGSDDDERAGAGDLLLDPPGHGDVR